MGRSAGRRRSATPETANTAEIGGNPLAGAGDRVLLGWRRQTGAAKIGFGAADAPAAVAGDPIWLDGEGHLITIAPTGAGKGRGALIPNLLTYEGPAIVIDPKGEACSVTARRRSELGQKVHIIDPFGLVTDASDSLNPMDAFDVPGLDQSAVAMDIAKQLSGGGRSVKDPFWDIRGHDLAAGIISAVASTAEGEERNLAKARRMIKADDVTYNLAVLLDTLGSKLHRFAYEEISSFLQTVEITRSGIHATAASYFSVIASDAAQRTIMKSTIDLAAVTRGDPMTIYLVVPPLKLASHAPLFRLWTSTLMAAVLARTGPLPRHRTLFAIDEVAQIGDFSMLSMVYTLARSYGMRCWAFFQDVAQIQRLLEKEWSTVLNNTGAIQAFGVSNGMMARDLAAVLGDFSEEQLRTMSPADLAIHVSGGRGLVARRPDYLLDEEFQGMADPHPMLGGVPAARGSRGQA